MVAVLGSLGSVYAAQGRLGDTVALHREAGAMIVRIKWKEDRRCVAVWAIIIVVVVAVVAALLVVKLGVELAAVLGLALLWGLLGR